MDLIFKKISHYDINNIDTTVNKRNGNQPLWLGKRKGLFVILSFKKQAKILWNELNV